MKGRARGFSKHKRSSMPNLSGAEPVSGEVFKDYQGVEMPQLELTDFELKTLLKLVERYMPIIGGIVDALPVDDETRQKLEERHAKYLALRSKLIEASGEVHVEMHELSLEIEE